jgi:hypothetical protein
MWCEISKSVGKKGYSGFGVSDITPFALSIVEGLRTGVWSRPRSLSNRGSKKEQDMSFWVYILR